MASDTRKVKLVCFGGCFHRHSNDVSFLYTYGINHVVSIDRSSSLADLYIKVSAFFPPPFVLRYQLPDGDLDSLVSLSIPEDLDNMMDELDCLRDRFPLRPARIRIFVSPVVLDAVSGSLSFLGFTGDPDARDDNSLSETENSLVSPRTGHRGAQFLNPNVSAVGVRGNVGFSPVETPKKINREIQVLNPTDNVFGFHRGMQFFSNNVSAVQIENPKTSQDETPLRNNQKCTAGEVNSLSEVSETSSPSKDLNVSVNGCNDAVRGGVVIPTALCYQDLSRLGFSGENSTLETKQTLATSAQFSNPGDYVASGNLNQSFPAKIQCGCNSKTNQEEKSLSGESTTLIPTRIDHPGVQVSNPNGNAVGIHPGNVRDDLMDSEESAYRSHHNYLYANDGDVFHKYHHQPLDQLPPLQPSYIMPSPLSYVPPQHLGPHSILRRDNCQRALPHSHSDPLSNGHGIGNVAGSSTFHETVSTLLSHYSEDPMRLQAAHRAMSGVEAGIETYPCENLKAAFSNLEVSDHAKVLHQPGSSRVLEESPRLQPSQRDTTGGLTDIVTEPNVDITNASSQLAPCEYVQKAHDNESLVHTKVQTSDSHSSVFAPTSTIGLSRDTPLYSGVSANHVMPLKSLHEGNLQQLPLTSSQQFGFNGSSVMNVNVPAAQAPSQVSVPEVSSESVRRINGMMEGLCGSSLEVRRLYDQQRQPVSVNVGSPRNVKSGNLPVVENDHILRSKFGDNTVFCGNAFVHQVMVPEGSSIRQNNPPSSINVKPGQHQAPVCNNQSVRPQLDVYALYLGNTFIGYGIVSKADPVMLINHMPPLATNYIRLLNVQPSETFQVSSLPQGPPTFYTQQMRVEPEVPSNRFFGMPKHLVGIGPVDDKDFNGNTIYKISVSDREGEASHSCHKDLNNMPGLPSGNFPTQHPIATCPTLQMYSKALPTVENGSFHKPQTSMNKDSGLEPVQFPQGKSNDISGLPSSNIPTQHPASRCPIDCTEQFQGPTPSSSLFSNQDPQQTLGSPSRPNDVPSKEIAAPMDLGSQNCRIYSTVPPTVENDIFHEPQTPRNKDSGLEPVLFPQVKLDNIPGLPSGNIPTQNPTSGCPIEHTEQFQEPAHSSSQFTNQDPYQILGSMQMTPSIPNEVSRKEFVVPVDMSCENCQIYDKVLPTVENDFFHQPQTYMNKDAVLEPVQFQQVKLNDISGLPSSNIPTQHPASRCPIDCTEQFQGPTPSTSLFSNQDPQQTLGSPSRPNYVPSREISATMDLGSLNCRIYSTVLPSVENDIFHQPQTPRNNDSGLEPVLFPQVKLDNIPGLPSGNIPTQNPTSGCPIEHTEQFQEPAPSSSQFTNQDPHQIPGSMQMAPSIPNEVSSKEFVVPVDMSCENCQIYDKVLPTVENGFFHQPQTSMNKDSVLEPVQFQRVKLNDISGLLSSNIAAQHPASGCPIDCTEQFQGPAPSSSLFSNQDPQQTLGSPSRPNYVPSKEISAPMDLGSLNCQIYSTVLPSVENGIFHQPQTPRNNDSGLEPVLFPQVKLDNIHGLTSGNIPTQYPTSRCPIEHTEQFQAPAPSSARFTNQDPHQILGSMQMAPSIPNEVSSKDFVVPVDMGCQNCQIYDTVPPSVENGFFHQQQTSMNKDSVLEPVQFPQGEEHNKKESLAAGVQVVASLLQAFVPTLAPISRERRESDPQSNNESGLGGGNTSLHNAVSLGEHKIEDIKTKQSEKVNLGIPVTDNIVHLQIIKNSDLEDLQELGSGAFGTVYHGKWKGSDVVIKRINNRFFAGKPSEEQRMREDFWNEACKLAELHHPNVVAFYGVVLDGPEGSYATVTEIMVSGSLRLALQRNNRSLDRRNQLLIAMDVAFGMEYLHDKNIVHSDLKSDNLLANLKDPQRPICKVSDLGLLKVKRQTVMSGGVRGTLPWMAPELLSPGGYLVSKKVDVYSFGIVMWELLTGEEPYADMHCGAIIGGIANNTLRPPVPESCDPDWKSLMEKCWSSDPSERPSFTEIATRLRSMAD